MLVEKHPFTTPSLSSISVRAMLFTAMGYDEVAALVFDNGGGMVKAGFANEDASRAVVLLILGCPEMLERLW